MARGRRTRAERALGYGAVTGSRATAHFAVVDARNTPPTRKGEPWYRRLWHSLLSRL
jgi:hypothetical protein